MLGFGFYTGYIGGDQVGEAVTALVNSNYVVASPGWSMGTGECDVGQRYRGYYRNRLRCQQPRRHQRTELNTSYSPTGDAVGSAVVALTNGNYVVASPGWSGGYSGKGAVTWGSGTAGVSGVVSTTNSLIGATSGDAVVRRTALVKALRRGQPLLEWVEGGGDLG